MDPITEQLSQLMELSDEQLAQLERTVLDEFETNESTELSTAVIERLESLATAVESVRSEQSRRVTERETLSAKAQEAAARVRGAEPAEEDPAKKVGDVPSEAPAPAAASTAAPMGTATEPVGAAPVATAPAAAAPAAEPVAIPTPGEPVAAKRPEEELAFTPKAKDPDLEEPTPPVTNPLPDTQDQPPKQNIDEELPIAGNPDIMPGPVDGEEEENIVKKSLAVEGELTFKKDPEEEPLPGDEVVPPADEEDEDKKGKPFSDTTENNTNPEAPVTASAGSEGLVITPPADRLPKTSKSATTLSITAGADIPSVSAGSTINDMGGVAEAFVKRLHTLRHVNGGDGEQHIVASLNYAFPESRQLSGGDAQENMNRIEMVAGQNIVAASGICIPLETDYDMHCDVGVTDRPVRDALARFNADRGGIRYFTSPQLTDFTNATGYWKRSGAAPGAPNIGSVFHTYGPDGVTPTNPADLKPCLEVTCPEERTAYIGAVTLCLTFNNLTGRVFPELIKRQNELALVQHARIAENNLLRDLEAGSTAVDIAEVTLGAAREIFALLARAVAAYRFRHRMATSAPLRMICASWVRELIRADIAMQMPGDGLDEVFGIADSKIEGWFRAKGVNVTWHLDGIGATQSATGFDFPDVVEFALFVEGTWLYLDGGTLDLGIIRDSSLVATNQYKQFVETFEGLVNLGCGSYWVTAPFQACGSAAALVETCAAAPTP